MSGEAPRLLDGTRRLLATRLDNVVLLSAALREIERECPDLHATLLASPAGAKAAPLLGTHVDDEREERVIWQDLEWGAAFEEALRLREAVPCASR